MKVLRFLIPILFTLPMGAQTSAFTATITDPDAQTWNNGTWNAQIYSPNGPPASNGTPLTTAQSNVSGTMNGSGVMSGTLFDNSLLTPTGTLWRFTLCPNASAPCVIGLVSVVGATPSLSTSLSNLITAAPRFPAGPFAYGYRDAEVSPSPVPGATYYNVTTPAFRQWSGSAWASIGSGGSVSITSDGSLTVSPSPLTGTGTIALNLGNANTWTAAQTISGASLMLTNESAANHGLYIASGTGSNFAIVPQSSTYTFLSFNGNFTNATNIGLLGGTSDNNIYIQSLGNALIMSTGTTVATFNATGNLALTSLSAHVYTVSTLPSASSLAAGTQVIVSDATTFTPGTCTGSGSDYMIAVTNGTTWSCH